MLGLTSGIKSKSSGNDIPNPNSASTFSHPWSSTILWGIPSVLNDPREKQRRMAIRETYLSYYKDKDRSTPDRICSLHHLLIRRVRPEDCQIAYAFFVGGNPKGPTELVNPNASFPMLVDRRVQQRLTLSPKDVSSHVHNVEPDDDHEEEEDDIVHLNIQENMEDGKMVTWFRYAAMVVAEMDQQHGVGVGFDYIAKVDSDTMVLIPTFLETLVQPQLKPFPDNIRMFGGLPSFNHTCDATLLNHTHPCPLPLVGDRYMSGELYFMTPDLASFIGSKQVNRQKLTIRHEDVSSPYFSILNSNVRHRSLVVTSLVSTKLSLFALLCFLLLYLHGHR
jgi:hypothetical protein